MIDVKVTDKSGYTKPVGVYSGRAKPFVEYNDLGYAEKYFISIRGEEDNLFLELDERGLTELKRAIELIDFATKWSGRDI